LADSDTSTPETVEKQVETDASTAAAELAASNIAGAATSPSQAMADEASSQLADARLRVGETPAASPATANTVYFGGTGTGNGAKLDRTGQDDMAAVNLISAATGGGAGGYPATTANVTALLADRNTTVNLRGTGNSHTPAGEAAVAAEAATMTAYTAAANGGIAAASVTKASAGLVPLHD
jgi:hypothetical protein